MNIETKPEGYSFTSGDGKLFLDQGSSSPTKYRARLQKTRLFAFVVTTIAVGLLLALIVEVSSKDGNSTEGDYEYHAEDGHVTFLVIGDWGRKSEYIEDPNGNNLLDGFLNQTAVASAMNYIAGEINAKFVISTGDNFYNNGIKTYDDPRFIETFTNVYIGQYIKYLPWYCVLGNHDYHFGGNASAQIGDPIKTVDPRWNMPQRQFFKSFASKDKKVSVDVFFIDTMPMLYFEYENGMGSPPSDYNFADVGIDTDPKALNQTLLAMRAELENWLKKSKATYRVVIGHHPLRSFASHGDTPGALLLVDDLLWKYGVHIYINGHDHVLHHVERQECCIVQEKDDPPKNYPFGLFDTTTATAMNGRSMHYVTSGAGSRNRVDPVSGLDMDLMKETSKMLYTGSGFISLKATPENLLVEFYYNTGYLYPHNITITP